MISNPIERLGATTIYHLQDLGRMAIFFIQSLLGIFKRPFKLMPILREMQLIGAQSLPVIIFTGAFTGMVLALQGYYSLRQFASEGLLGSAVGLSLIRELAPVLTGLMVTGRAGSAMCAEMGIMRISEQIDALECMAIDPFRYLIAPKVLATIISMPILTLIFSVVGILGGYLVGVVTLGGTAGAYFSSMEQSVVNADITMGLIKSLVFALLIVWICTGRGFFVQLIREAGFGAQSVSRVTTQAVVMASIAILVWDYLLTALLL